ncbi:hypothetical protein A33M_0538 [Rhodovulum sp. PH10]|nr:hypothetical protein A33M_0538 [Rhodovulum sp. PH10]
MRPDGSPRRRTLGGEPWAADPGRLAKRPPAHILSPGTSGTQPRGER